jgi:hypothetical protein
MKLRGQEGALVRLLFQLFKNVFDVALAKIGMCLAFSYYSSFYWELQVRDNNSSLFM